jgi:hypothetical protein
MLENPASAPMKVFAAPIVLHIPDLDPTNELPPPLVLLVPEFDPINVLNRALDWLFIPALSPIIVFLKPTQTCEIEPLITTDPVTI